MGEPVGVCVELGVGKRVALVGHRHCLRRLRYPGLEQRVEAGLSGVICRGVVPLHQQPVAIGRVE